MSLSGRLVSCVSMPFVPPAFGSLGNIDSLKIQPDQPGHATCLTFASGTGEFEKVGHLAAFSAMTDAAGPTHRYKSGPSDLRRRHRQGQRGGLVRTGPWGSRSAARHTSGNR